MILELGRLGLEVQVDTKALIMANSAVANEASAKLEAKLDCLRNDLKNLTHPTERVNEITLDTLRDRSTTTGEFNVPSRCNIIEDSSTLGRHADQRVVTIPMSPACSLEPGKDVKNSQERAKEMQRYLTRRDGVEPTSALISAGQLPHRNFESILLNIRTFYTAGNFDASPKIRKTTKYWTDTDLAIYLTKVSTSAIRGSSKSQTRGSRVLKTLTADDANFALNEGKTVILIELLSTLSPVNTKTCPDLRNAILRQLSQLTREHLGSHPIRLVINLLKDDKNDEHISLRALTFIVERLHSVLGPVHELTQLATNRLCALLRRASDYSEALRIAYISLQAIRATKGLESPQERKLLRQVEHVYIDQCDWVAALSVCFGIFGQQSDTSNPDPSYHDECAVSTMEDISKTFECAGNMDQAALWLKQAIIGGGML